MRLGLKCFFVSSGTAVLFIDQANRLMSVWLLGLFRWEPDFLETEIMYAVLLSGPREFNLFLQTQLNWNQRTSVKHLVPGKFRQVEFSVEKINQIYGSLNQTNNLLKCH